MGKWCICYCIYAFALVFERCFILRGVSTAHPESPPYLDTLIVKAKSDHCSYDRIGALLVV